MKKMNVSKAKTAIRMFTRGDSTRRISATLKVNLSTVYRWVSEKKNILRRKDA